MSYIRENEKKKKWHEIHGVASPSAYPWKDAPQEHCWQSQDGSVRVRGSMQCSRDGEEKVGEWR